MKKSVIFSFVKMTDSSMVASVRIARFLSEVLGLNVWSDEQIGEYAIDNLIIVNGAYAFAGNKILEALGTAIVNAERVIWIQNDYTVVPPKDESGAESPFRKAFRIRHEKGKPPVDYWTTVELMSRPGRSPSGHICGPDSTYVNWNCLTTEFQTTMPENTKSWPDHLAYYGSFRKDREKTFRRYLLAPRVPVVVSSPSKKFEEKYPLIKFYGKQDHIYSFLSNCGVGLYLEDDKSHAEFHSPANRFYEMISSNLPIIFQPECMRMMERAGYDVSPFVAWEDQIPFLIEKRHELLLAQRPWMDRIREERAALPGVVREIWTRYQ